MKKRGPDAPQGGRKPDDEAAHLELELESTSSQTLRGVRIQEGRSTGSDPYDAAARRAAQTNANRLDEMRRLSEWIRLKRAAEDPTRKK